MSTRTIWTSFGMMLLSHTAMAQFTTLPLTGQPYAYINMVTANSAAVLGLSDKVQMYLTVYSDLPMTFQTNSTERMRITAAGAVGIGTKVPAYLLQVNGTAGGTSAWTVASDARLKKNIQPITGAIDLVKRLRGVRYRWRSVGEREVGKELRLPLGEPQIGFIAQEVEAVVPEAVSVPKAGSGDIYGVEDDKLLPILVEAVKEQQAEIVQLRATLADLKSTRTEAPSGTISPGTVQIRP